MKEFLTSLILLCAFSSAFAATWDPHKKSQQTFASAVSDSKVGWWLDVKQSFSADYTMQVVKPSVRNFGYYIMDNSFNVLETRTLDTAGGTIYASAGDMVGFWYENDGNVYSSIIAQNENRGFYFAGRESLKDGGRNLAFIGKKSGRIATIRLKSPVPAGQPLPSVFMTLGVGLVPFVGLKLFRKKAKKSQAEFSISASK